MLDNPNSAAMKDKAVREAVFRILSVAALRYAQLESISASLVNLLSKHEHLPPVLAQLAEFAAATNSDGRLVSNCCGRSRAKGVAGEVGGTRRWICPQRSPGHADGQAPAC
jgi:hypothetical protein